VAPQNDATFGIGTLAGLLLGKTRLDSVYGLKMSPIVNCAAVLANSADVSGSRVSGIAE
jgi:hypothetical protein